MLVGPFIVIIYFLYVFNKGGDHFSVLYFIIPKCLNLGSSEPTNGPSSLSLSVSPHLPGIIVLFITISLSFNWDNPIEVLHVLRHCLRQTGGI